MTQLSAALVPRDECTQSAPAVDTGQYQTEPAEYLHAPLSTEGEGK